MTLESSCSTKFQVNNNGSLQVTASGLCIQSESLDKIPENDGNVVADSACTQIFNVIQAKGTIIIIIYFILYLIPIHSIFSVCCATNVE